MEESNKDVTVDTLFVGLTRPPIAFGIPYEACVIEFMAIAVIFLATGNLLILLTVVPLHSALYLLSSEDPGVFASYFLWLKTIARCRNRRFWNAASFSPMPTKKWRN